MSELSAAFSANTGTSAVSGETEGRHRARRAVVALLRGYQVARSGHPSPCRFTPTCSHYAVEAVTLHGVRRGAGLTIRRLLRCRPGGPFGYDPVPPADLSCPVSDCPPVPE